MEPVGRTMAVKAAIQVPLPPPPTAPTSATCTPAPILSAPTVIKTTAVPVPGRRTQKSPPSGPTPPPHPAVPPARDLSQGESDYWAYGTSIYTNAWSSDGHPTRLRIKGVSWFGMEGPICHPGGLWHRPLEDYAAFLRKHGFNAVRIPLAVDALTGLMDHPCLIIPAEHKVAARGNNPHLYGLTYLDGLARFVELLGNRGILVLLDMHVVEAGKWPDGGSVDANGEAQLRAAWQLVAQRLCDPRAYWNVFAAGAALSSRDGVGA